MNILKCKEFFVINFLQVFKMLISSIIKLTVNLIYDIIILVYDCVSNRIVISARSFIELKNIFKNLYGNITHQIRKMPG